MRVSIGITNEVIKLGSIQHSIYLHERLHDALCVPVVSFNNYLKHSLLLLVRLQMCICIQLNSVLFSSAINKMWHGSVS